MHHPCLNCGRTHAGICFTPCRVCGQASYPACRHDVVRFQPPQQNFYGNPYGYGTAGFSAPTAPLALAPGSHQAPQQMLGGGSAAMPTRGPKVGAAGPMLGLPGKMLPHQGISNQAASPMVLKGGRNAGATQQTAQPSVPGGDKSKKGVKRERGDDDDDEEEKARRAKMTARNKSRRDKKRLKMFGDFPARIKAQEEKLRIAKDLGDLGSAAAKAEYNMVIATAKTAFEKQSQAAEQKLAVLKEKAQKPVEAAMKRLQEIQEEAREASFEMDVDDSNALE